MEAQLETQTIKSTLKTVSGVVMDIYNAVFEGPYIGVEHVYGWPMLLVS